MLKQGFDPVATLERDEPEPRHQRQHAKLAAMTAQFGAVGDSGSGNPGIGGDAVAADVHVGAARAEACRYAALAQIDPHTREHIQHAMKTKAHQTSSAAVSALSWMNSRRGSTSSPISLVKRSSASSACSTFTCSRVRAFSSSVVSQS